MQVKGSNTGLNPPRIRLSGFYGAYFAVLGVLIPFWPLYLEQLGYGAAAIGVVMGIVPGTKIVMPAFWGWLADRTGRTLSLIRWTSLLSALALAFLIPCREDFGFIVLTMLVFGMFWNGSLPLFETVTLAHLRGRGGYGRVRLWGSIGFVASVTLGGFAFGEYFPIRMLPELMVGILLVQWLVALTVPGINLFHPKREGSSFIRILLKPAVLAFLTAAFLLQFAHGPYYALYSVWLKNWGYGDLEVGLLWALGVVAEVILFIWIDPLERRLGLRLMLILSLVSGVLRWPLMGWFPDSLAMMVLSQLLHAGSFGLMHVTTIAISYTHLTLPTEA